MSMNLKETIFFMSLVVAMATGCNNASTSSDLPDNKEKELVDNTPDKVLKHVVVFKYKEEATEEKVNEINDAFANLQNEIPEIKGFEWGINNSPEGLDQDFTHVYQVTFHTEKGREIYLPHPAHKAFVELIGPSIEKVFVVDYWTE